MSVWMRAPYTGPLPADIGVRNDTHYCMCSIDSAPLFFGRRHSGFDPHLYSYFCLPSPDPRRLFRFSFLFRLSCTLPMLHIHFFRRKPYAHPPHAIHPGELHFHTAQKGDASVPPPLGTPACFKYWPTPGIYHFRGATHSACEELKRIHQGSRLPSPFAPLIIRAKRRIPTRWHTSIVWPVRLRFKNFATS